jgi:hypothetical protein
MAAAGLHNGCKISFHFANSVFDKLARQALGDNYKRLGADTCPLKHEGSKVRVQWIPTWAHEHLPTPRLMATRRAVGLAVAPER